jgi:hypothetical protein
MGRPKRESDRRGGPRSNWGAAPTAEPFLPLAASLGGDSLPGDALQELGIRPAISRGAPRGLWPVTVA